MNPVTSNRDLDGLAERVRETRDLATAWLLARIGDDGAPVGTPQEHGWPRVPWALAVAGERAVGNAVLSWAEREALDDNADFRSHARPAISSAYPLSHLAIGAWMLERYDTALRIMDRLRDYQAPSGGVFVEPPENRAGSTQDWLCTAQLGYTALVTRQQDIADAAFGWLTKAYAAQPELPNRLYSLWNDKGLVTGDSEVPKFFSGSSGRPGVITNSTVKGGTELPPFMIVVDFTQPHQAYFQPGMAAAFLGGYAAQTGNNEALKLAHNLLQLNIDGTDEQFDDVESVQICKFGWGVAVMAVTERSERYLDQVARMAAWFVERQDEDGAWRPSPFLVPQPTEADKLLKTAEHLMEVVWLEDALAAHTGVPPHAEPSARRV